MLVPIILSLCLWLSSLCWEENEDLFLSMLSQLLLLIMGHGVIMPYPLLQSSCSPFQACIVNEKTYSLQ